MSFITPSLVVCCGIDIELFELCNFRFRVVGLKFEIVDSKPIEDCCILKSKVLSKTCSNQNQEKGINQC